MNRRSFLKSLTAVCGAAVVCPGELLKKKRRPGLDKIPYGIPYWLCNKDGRCFRSENEVMLEEFRRNIMVKTRDMGCTVSTINWIRCYMRACYETIQTTK